LERSNSNIFGTELYWSTPIVTLIVTIGAKIFCASFYRNRKKTEHDFIVMIGAVTIGAMLQSYHIPLLNDAEQ